MFYYNEWIRDNIFVNDSHDMKIGKYKGDNCFIIGHHIKDQYIIDNSVINLLNGGFNFFNIFGEQSNLWAKAIDMQAIDQNVVTIEKSKVDRDSMPYNLAMYATLEPESRNFVFSDDEYFTEYLIEDMNDIFSGETPFTPYDWQKFKRGFEFTYNGKDAIISVFDDIVIGFLGDEKTFKTIYKGFNDKIFDGKSLVEIWERLSSK